MLKTIKNEIKMMFTGGRLNRMRYIAYQGFASTCIGAIAIILAFLIPEHGESNSPGLRNYMLMPVFAIYITLTLWWLKRRLNDTGKSAKWLWRLIPIGLLLIFLPSIMEIITPESTINYIYQIENVGNILKIVTAAMYLLGMLSLYIAGFILVYALFARGTDGTNLFGSPPPKNNLLISTFFTLYIIFLGLSTISKMITVAENSQNQQQSSIEDTNTSYNS